MNSFNERTALNYRLRQDALTMAKQASRMTDDAKIAPINAASIATVRTVLRRVARR